MTFILSPLTFLVPNPDFYLVLLQYPPIFAEYRTVIWSWRFCWPLAEHFARLHCYFERYEISPKRYSWRSYSCFENLIANLVKLNLVFTLFRYMPYLLKLTNTALPTWSSNTSLIVQYACHCIRPSWGGMLWCWTEMCFDNSY